jgi:phosphatidyl-myo-inositol dimannoside synthase
VGRLIERKGQHHLIDAVKQLAEEAIDVRLDLVGTGDARSSYEAQVSRLGLGDRVRFLGYVPREEISQHYAAAHVFILPSYNEGMSVALLEAMASGLAVLVTPTGGTPELVETGVNGLVFDWADVERLASHLRRLAQDRLLVRRMGEASSLRAQSFSWEAAAQRYLEIFNEIASVNRANASFKIKAERKAS